MTPFPWEAAMQFGFGILRLSPLAFWSMTPRELSAAYTALVGNGVAMSPMGRDTMVGLMTRFPDRR